MKKLLFISVLVLLSTNANGGTNNYCHPILGNWVNPSKTNCPAIIYGEDGQIIGEIQETIAPPPPGCTSNCAPPPGPTPKNNHGHGNGNEVTAVVLVVMTPTTQATDQRIINTVHNLSAGQNLPTHYRLSLIGETP
jgi:hypothetical protein